MNTSDVLIPAETATKLYRLPFATQAVYLILLEALGQENNTQLYLGAKHGNRVEKAYREACTVFGWDTVQDALAALENTGILDTAA